MKAIFGFAWAVAVGWVLVILINHFLAAKIGQFEFGFIRFFSDCSAKYFGDISEFLPSKLHRSRRLAENWKYDDNRSRQENFTHSGRTYKDSAEHKGYSS
jgi:hypothetical protein